MTSTAQSLPRAWEPLSPRGVAAFAMASLGRLLLVQCMIAVLAAGTVVWFLEEACFPIVRAAILQLPAQGEIRDGHLVWPGDSPVQLAGNHSVGVAVDLNHGGQLARDAQLQVEFGRKDFRVISMFGYVVVDYPGGWRMAFNRTELDPWWGAWEPAILAGTALATALGLMLVWTALASLYCIPARVITLFENRDLSWGQSWRLAGAALMPGALFMIFGIIGYGLNWIDLVQLGAMAGLHLPVGWIYLFISPLFLPRHPEAAAVKPNPFAGDAQSAKDAAVPKSPDTP